MAESPKPKRRFAPEPVETTFNTNRKPNAQAQAEAQPKPKPKRFAPVPLETTFTSNSNRKPQRASQQPATPERAPRTGPAPELTPEPSPTSTITPALHPLQSHPSRDRRRRFAPQLIETSRRSRKVGDSGPTTKPADKTDITPYTNHIYTAKSRHRRKQDGTKPLESRRALQPPTRRETEDETFKQYLLDLAAKEAERQIQEAALAVFPNSRAREGGVAHFYFREGSDSDDTPEQTTLDEGRGRKKVARARRESSGDVDMGWWQQHMQKHAKHLQDQRHQQHDDDSDKMDLDGSDRGPTESEIDRMDLSAPPDPIWTTSSRQSFSEGQGNSANSSGRPFAGIASDARNKDALESGGFTQNPFGRPFGAFGLRADPQAEALRKAASPPMLGKDLVFRTCPSPKMTKLEPNHPFVQRQQIAKHRDVTGQKGLWRGFCYNKEDAENDPVDNDSGESAAATMTEEPSLLSSISSDSYVSASLWQPAATSPSKQRGKPGGLRGSLHMSHGGIEDRLKQGRANPEDERIKDDKIAQEFDHVFVTQVYNYLSLGYPSMAKAFDDELSKISRLNRDDLARDDETQAAKGHMAEMSLREEEVMAVEQEEDKCPRWKALRIYITEWARQHPDLDNLDPLAWDVRERRESEVVH